MKTHQAIELRTAHETDQIALRGVRLRARLSGMSLKATLEQTFVNLESKAIEALYTFPLPETAAVCGFEVLTGEHVLTGKVEENDEALRQYDDAISQGDGAFMLEQDRPDVFTARVGNLKPGQAATIRISYIAPLERADRSIRIRFPTTIAPRYKTAAGCTDPLAAVIDGDTLNPPHVLSVPYGLELDVETQLGPDVQQISSPTHALDVRRPQQASDPWSIRLSGGLAEMDRDLVLQIDLGRETEPQVQLVSGPDEAKYLAVTFVPEFKEESLGEHRASETVFLLDCSGSMQGQSIQQAIAALELCLRSLSSGDTFNICRFGSSHDLLAPESLTYSATTLKQALAFIRCDADLGGTELYRPLEAILSVPPTAGTLRNVVVLTDGQVTNEPAVVELARTWRSTNRLFTFGIGSSASGYLVRNLARVSSGAAEFISGNERIEDKVLRTFSRIDSPMVSDVTVDWGGAEVQTAAEIPPVFDGDLLRVLARAPGRVPTEITLRCQLAGGEQSWTLAVPPSTSDENVIATAWARSMIEAWDDAAAPTSRPAGREASSDRRLVNISKQFGVLCSRTSFVAVEHRSLEDRNAGMPELRRVPLKLAHGWGGIEMCAPACGAGSVMACSPPPAPARMKRSFHIGGLPGYGYDLLSEPDSHDVPEIMSAPPANHLHRMLASQSAEGWFDTDSHQVLKDAGYDAAGREATVSGLCTPLLAKASTQLRGRFLATVIVVAALHCVFADERSSWRRAEAKARRWLKQAASLDDAALDQLLEAAGKSPV
jgi:Ca-activated chloride channel family protein